MKNHWGNRAAVLLIAGGLIGAVAACSTDDAPDQKPAAVEGVPDDRPKAPPVKLPAAWDGMNGGLFKFSATHPIYTENGILTLSPDKEPVIWSWDGTARVLKPETDADKVNIVSSHFLDRDGKQYPVTVWNGTKNATGLGDAVVTQYVTTWDERGENVLFQGTVDVDESLGNKGWGSAGGMLVHGVSLGNQLTGDDREVVLDPMTGKVSRGATMEETEGRISYGYEDTNPSLTIVRPEPGAPGRITNTETGKVTTVSIEDLCGSRDLTTVVSSFDGRYLALGKRVIDTETDTSTCLDSAGSPSLQAITADGVGYGVGTRNGNDVVISYDFAKNEIEILSDAMVAPSFIGPNGEAVVTPSRGSRDPIGVYRAAK